MYAARTCDGVVRLLRRYGRGVAFGKEESQAEEVVSVVELVIVACGWLRQARGLAGCSEVKRILFALCGFAKVKPTLQDNRRQSEVWHKHFELDWSLFLQQTILSRWQASPIVSIRLIVA